MRSCVIVFEFLKWGEFNKEVGEVFKGFILEN